MISFLVPTFNHNCSPLLLEIYKQGNQLELEFEISVRDDGSSNTQHIAELKNDIVNTNIQLFENIVNLGRSNTRNLLAKFSKFDNLIFIDSDSEIPEDYVKNYLQNISKLGNNVFCGGTKLSAYNGEKHQTLHRKYSQHRELKSTTFQSNNFMISKSNFEKILFDETIKTYGHEDTLFGQELLEHSISIIKINNPVIHTHLETNENFIHKQRDAVQNLAILYLNNKIRSTKLINAFLILKKYSLIHVFNSLYRAFKKVIIVNLKSNSPNLLLLDVYKLYHFSKKVIDTQNT